VYSPSLTFSPTAPPTIEVVYAAIPFLALPEWNLNAHWNECFQLAIRDPPAPDHMTPPMFDLLLSQGDFEGMKILERHLGKDPFWAATLYTYKVRLGLSRPLLRSRRNR
jgi:hypothetical protein